MTPAELRRVIEQHSDTFAPLSAQERSELRDASEAILTSVAAGEDRVVIDAVERTIARFTDRLAAVGRDPEGFRHLSRICLYGVRAHQHAGDDAAAVAMAVGCHSLIPDLLVERRWHPPDVRATVSDARNLLPREPAVRIVTHDADPSGCAIRANGRRVGETPTTRIHARPGTTLQVQVDCAARQTGRVHTIQATEHDTSVTVHASLDDALQTAPGPALCYPDDAVAEDRIEAAASSLSRILAMPVLAAFRGNDEDRLVLARGDRVALARIVVGDASALEAALEHIARGEDFSDAALARTHSEAGSPSAGGVGAGGWILGIAGALGIAGTWISYSDWANHQELLQAAEPGDIDFDDRESRRDERTTRTALIGGASSLLLTAAVPFFVGESGITWVGVVAGVIGAALTAIGAVLWANDERCDDGNCDRSMPLGVVLIDHGVPLLAVPIFQLALDGGGSG